MKKALPYILAAAVAAVGLVPVVYGIILAFRSGYAWLRWSALVLGIFVAYQVGRASVACYKGMKEKQYKTRE